MSLANLSEIEAELGKERVPPQVLYQIWAQRRPVPEATGASKKDSEAAQVPWLQGDLSLVLLFAQKAMLAEEHLLICDLGREVERLGRRTEESDAHLRLRMLHAQALARLGALNEARKLLRKSDTRQVDRPLQADQLSLMGDLFRVESAQLAPGATRRPALEYALEYYRQARLLQPERLFTIVVAAGVASLLGDREAARRDAEAALRLVEAQGLDEKPTFATEAARAAALALIGRLDEAYGVFAALQETPGRTTPLLAAARYQAQFVAEAAGRERGFFRSAFPPLQLLVFAGHMPRDEAGGRLPAERIGPARAAIRRKLQDLDARAGLGSAAAGGDLLFLDELLGRGAAVHVVLPWAREEFRKVSVLSAAPAPPPEPSWNALFDRGLQQAASLRELGQLYQPRDETGWRYLSEVSSGLALATARIARLDVQPIALWDRQPGPSGGTAGFVNFWTRAGQRVEIVDVDEPSGLPWEIDGSRVERIERPSVANLAGGGASPLLAESQEVKTMLFADIVGYSRLPEHVIPKFISVFLPEVAELRAASAYGPITVNTWGDAVYAVFDFAVYAGCFALELAALIRKLEQTWLDAGLFWEETRPDGRTIRRPLSVRIGLHTGPVFLHYDSVARHLGYTGAHVNRAARIEPVARPGEIYASEEFAALAALDTSIAEPDSARARAAKEFLCDYAGTMTLAKGYPGRYRIYRVLPRRELDIEVLAEAIHEAYCVKAQERHESAATNPALLPWDKLPEEFREANREQAIDIPAKLRSLGYELAFSDGLEPHKVSLRDEDVERLARREHDRWMAERTRKGWTFAPVRNNELKHHPSIVPWEELNEVERDKDREPVRNALALVGRAGFRLRKIEEEGAVE